MAGTLITTTRGLMDPDELEKREIVHEDDNERSVAVEYWTDGELVHRSVALHLKRGMFADGLQADFS